MKAKVVEIQSKSYRAGTKPNPYRMIALQFELGLVEGGPVILRLPEYHLGIIGLQLDDEIDVKFDVEKLEPQGIEEQRGER